MCIEKSIAEIAFYEFFGVLGMIHACLIEDEVVISVLIFQLIGGRVEVIRVDILNDKVSVTTYLVFLGIIELGTEMPTNPLAQVTSISM